MSPRGQEPNESTDDAVWQDIVSRLQNTPGDDPGEQEAEDQPTDRERVEAIFRNQHLRPSGPRDYEEPEVVDAEQEDDGYIPPEPPPLGTGDPLLVLSWLGAAGGPVLLVLFAMFWRDAPVAATLGVLAMFLAGAGFLLFRLPRHRDFNDDGAEI